MELGSGVQKLASGRKLTEQERLTYAQQVRGIRSVRGMSQADLAEAAGVGRGTIINIETGKTVPQADVLLRLMRALDMVVEESSELPEWLAGNLEIIANMMLRVPEAKRPEVLATIFTTIIQATPTHD